MPEGSWFGPLKRWFEQRPSAGRWDAVSQWAEAQGRVFKRSRDGSGFIVEGDAAPAGWRLEWGAPQRSYIGGPELRLRLEGGLPPELQMLVLTRPLLEALESATFDKFVEFNETHIDVATPEELRWLAMYQRADFTDLADGKRLADGYAAVAFDLRTVERWLGGPLGEQLVQAAATWLAERPPFVLMALRGKLYLRLLLAQPDLGVIEAAVALFETAHTTAQALHLTRTGTARRRDAPPA